MLEYRVMGQDLKHLAFVIDSTQADAGSDDLHGWVRRLVGHCTALALHSLDEVPGLEGLSFFYPELQSAATDGSAPHNLLSSFTEAVTEAGAAIAARGFELALLGYRDLLPASWASALSPAPSLQEYPNRVNFFLGYSGREEIVRAAETAIGPSGEGEPSEGRLGSGLLSAGQPDPDFIIYGTSLFTPKDFMIWQASYAEIWQTPAAGFAFTTAILDEALELYALRVRRFGKV